MYLYFHNFYNKIRILNSHKKYNLKCKYQANNYERVSNGILDKSLFIQNDKVIDIFKNNNEITYVFKDFEIKKTIEFLFLLNLKKKKFQDSVMCNEKILDIYFSIKKDLRLESTNAKVTIFGHGIGGMVALLFYLDIEMLHENIEIFLFGVPRTCDESLNIIIDKRRLKIKNYILLNDYVLNIIEGGDYKHIKYSKVKDSVDLCNIHSFQNYLESFNFI